MFSGADVGGRDVQPLIQQLVVAEGVKAWLRVVSRAYEVGDLSAMGRDLGDVGSVGGLPIHIDEMSGPAVGVRVEREGCFNSCSSPRCWGLQAPASDALNALSQPS